MRSLVLAAGVAAVVATGCGPVQVSSSVKRAEETLREARLRGWDRDCPYEIAAAEGYLSAARDLAGRSEFSAAREFADRASALAASTRDLAPRNARARETREKGGSRIPVPGDTQAPAPGTGGTR